MFQKINLAYYASRRHSPTITIAITTISTLVLKYFPIGQYSAESGFQRGKGFGIFIRAKLVEWL